MFDTAAYAQAAPGAAPGFDLMAFLPLILIFVVFYFLLIRPQQKKLKEHRAMLEALRRGDRVVTGGGIIGTVTKADTDEVTLEIAEGVRVRVVKGMISTVLAKTEPAKGGRSGEDKPAEASAQGSAQEGGVRGLGKMFGRK